MTPDDPTSSSALPASPDLPLLVVGFCAAWCDTCGVFRATFDALAAARPTARFVWLDIEDDAGVVGDIDIENFPTIAVYAGDRLLHFGVSLPQGPIVTRLIDTLAADHPAAVAEEAVTTLPSRLRRGWDSPTRHPG